MSHEIPVTWTTDKVLIALILLMTGCVNINTRLQPEDTSVKEVLVGRDCVPIIFGFGIGTATFEQAKANGQPFGTSGGYYTPKPRTSIVKVRRVESSESAVLMFGERCVEVTGEP